MNSNRRISKKINTSTINNDRTYIKKMMKEYIVKRSKYKCDLKKKTCKNMIYCPIKKCRNKLDKYLLSQKLSPEQEIECKKTMKSPNNEYNYTKCMKSFKNKNGEIDTANDILDNCIANECDNENILYENEEEEELDKLPINKCNKEKCPQEYSKTKEIGKLLKNKIRECNKKTIGMKQNMDCLNKDTILNKQISDSSMALSKCSQKNCM
jgi:hypothetical protein